MKIKLLLLIVCVFIWYFEYKHELKEIMAELVLPKGRKDE